LQPRHEVSPACEAILLSAGLVDEAWQRYALKATQASTYLATFRAIAAKYPCIPAEKIQAELVANSPGCEGHWFAAAKEAGLFDLVFKLAFRGPCDPHTMNRAARDYGEKQPEFALGAGLAWLYWMACECGYEITGGDVLAAHDAALQAAQKLGPAPKAAHKIHEICAAAKDPVVRTVLARHLAS